MAHRYPKNRLHNQLFEPLAGLFPSDYLEYLYKSGIFHSHLEQILYPYQEEKYSPYWYVNRLAGGVIVFRAVLVGHGNRVEGEFPI